MKLLCPMTYFRPYVSGPIIYIETLGLELTRRGHQVTFLASQHDAHLPLEEIWNRIRVVRVPVRGRISKGVVMPSFPRVARRLLEEVDAVLIQVPQAEASLLALMCRWRGVPSLLTYHCDVELPRGFSNRVVGGVLLASNIAAASAATKIVAYTADYARHSPVMSRFMHKVVVIPPPVSPPLVSAEKVEAFRRR
ncbi:MAG TPA: glycosyltransferase family 4 protein, partial [Chthoniobacterales bacterium]